MPLYLAPRFTWGFLYTQYDVVIPAQAGIHSFIFSPTFYVGFLFSRCRQACPERSRRDDAPMPAPHELGHCRKLVREPLGGGANERISKSSIKTCHYQAQLIEKCTPYGAGVHLKPPAFAHRIRLLFNSVALWDNVNNIVQHVLNIL